MKEGLEKLFSLQQTDDNITDIEKIIEEIPQTIKELEGERDGRAQIIEKAKEKLQQNIKQRERYEKEILQIKEKIKKYKEQMNKSTTNREYQGFMTEIKYEENRISGIEEKIIGQMLESDEIMDEIRERESEFKQIAEEYNKKINDLNHNLSYHREKLNEVTAAKAAISETVPGDLLKVYHILYKKKAGKAVSLVETEFCGVCNIKIRPQRLSELITTRDLFICENCGRILFKKVEEANAES